MHEITANTRKTSSIRHLGPVHIAELKKAVLALPESVWDAENDSKPNRFDALDATRHIVFRFVSNFIDWRQSFDRPLWNEWRPLLEPVLSQATAAYGYSNDAFPRVMLARMAPGGSSRNGGGGRVTLAASGFGSCWKGKRCTVPPTDWSRTGRCGFVKMTGR